MKWEHPAKELIDVLRKKTRSKIIRTDKIPPKKPKNIPKEEWKAFTKNLDWDRSEDKLWIQYSITG